MLDDVASPDALRNNPEETAGADWSIVEGPFAVLGNAPFLSDRERALSRRQVLRFEAIANLLWMQWWDGEHYLGRSARLWNVSRGGALIVSSVLLHVRQQVRIFLEEMDEPVGVSGAVLGVQEGRNGMHLIRVGFHSPCPDEFIHAAAFGFETWLAQE